MSASNVCQFFLQGKCKFGTKCRNHHPGTQVNVFNSLTGRPSLSSNQYAQQRQQQNLTKSVGYNRFSLLSDDSNLGNWHGTSSSNGNTRTSNIFSLPSKRSSSDTATLNPFLAQQQQQQQQLEEMGEDDVPNIENIKSILQSDVMDMSNCSTLWPLTSYSPIGGTSMFPEFEDISAEEIRWEYCLAQGTNNVHEYVGKLQQLIVKRKTLISQLAVIKGEDLTNRVMSVKDNLLLTATPVVQNPVPQSNTKPLAMVSTLSQLPTKASTASSPVTTTITINSKPSSQKDPTTISSISNSMKTSSTSLTKEDIDAFKADKFTLGKIPTCAPPPELC